MAAVTEGIKSIVSFLTQGFDQQRDDVFEDMVDDMGDDYETEDNLALAPAYSTGIQSRNESKNDLKVVAHPNYRTNDVMFMEPRSFSEAGQVVQNLKDRKIIVLNLHLLDKEQSQRTIDFVCGAAHALSGNAKKAGDMVFVFTPSNVTLSVDSTTGQTKFTDSLWNRPVQM